MMKKLVLATGVCALMGGAALSGVAGAVTTTEALAAMCKDKSNVAEQNFCHGYSQGVYDKYVASLHPKRNPAYICFPNPGPNRQTAIDGFVTWSAANPKLGKVAAADSLMRYLAVAYPCKK